MAKNPEIPAHTHKVTLTIYSDSVNPDVWVQMDCDPNLTGADFVELGYFPASFRFLQEQIVPMLDRAFAESMADLATLEPPTDTVN